MVAAVIVAAAITYATGILGIIAYAKYREKLGKPLYEYVEPFTLTCLLWPAALPLIGLCVGALWVGKKACAVGEAAAQRRLDRAAEERARVERALMTPREAGGQQSPYRIAG